MIDRYARPDMKKLWTNASKFEKWLEVELAVLAAREELGQIPTGTTGRVKERTWMDEKVAAIIEWRDREIHHDLNAFVEIMRLQIAHGRLEFTMLYAIDGDPNAQISHLLGSIHNKCPDAGWFHDGMTSYDTEEPAMAILLDASANLIDRDLTELEDALEDRAEQHRGQFMIGRTHGQHAQPITFGIKCLNWLESVKHARDGLAQIMGEIDVMKLSGAVGVYGTLGPEVEEKVAEHLCLESVIATQIVPLDRRARLVNELAVIGSVAEKIARDLWLMCQTEIGEIREPFSEKQKGSSAMPHKKNPIKLEQVMGLARNIRAYAMCAMENIATAHERDISHSSVERTAVVDAFGLLDHMLQTITGVIKKMDVFPNRMLDNLELTCGVIASQKVEVLLKQLGMGAEAAYRAVQRLSVEAVKARRPLRDLLVLDQETMVFLEDKPVELDACFDWASWLQHEDYIYRRAGVAI